MHVADAVAGGLACELAQHEGKAGDHLARYMSRHIESAILSLGFLALKGMGSKARPREAVPVGRAGRAAVRQRGHELVAPGLRRASYPASLVKDPRQTSSEPLLIAAV